MLCFLSNRRDNEKILLSWKYQFSHKRSFQRLFTCVIISWSVIIFPVKTIPFSENWWYLWRFKKNVHFYIYLLIYILMPNAVFTINTISFRNSAVTNGGEEGGWDRRAQIFFLYRNQWFNWYLDNSWTWKTTLKIYIETYIIARIYIRLLHWFFTIFQLTTEQLLTIQRIALC